MLNPDTRRLTRRGGPGRLLRSHWRQHVAHVLGETCADTEPHEGTAQVNDHFRVRAVARQNEPGSPVTKGTEHEPGINHPGSACEVMCLPLDGHWHWSLFWGRRYDRNVYAKPAPKTHEMNAKRH